ncbi:MAG: hypothetical protein J1E64_08355 [Acetatifactor sp.]|nr:hypothetical protein [Acetatifactor sp.]
MAVYDFIFDFPKISYADPILEIDVLICGKGRCRAATDNEAISEDKLKSGIESILPEVFAVCTSMGVRYDSIYKRNEDMLNKTQALLGERDEFQESVKIESFTIVELYPVDEEIPKIIEAKRRPPKSSQPVAASVPVPAPEQKNEWICRSCGKNGRGKFCPYCGSPRSLENTAAQSPQRQAGTKGRFCKKCGANLIERPAGLKFCPQCGSTQFFYVDAKVAEEVKRTFGMFDKVAAIKFYREKADVGLEEAKNAVELIFKH